MSAHKSLHDFLFEHCVPYAEAINAGKNVMVDEVYPVELSDEAKLKVQILVDDGPGYSSFMASIDLVPIVTTIAVSQE